jgi:hypothetical protein
MIDNGWFQGQGYLTNIVHKKWAVWVTWCRKWVDHITNSTQNYRKICGIDMCSNYDMRVSTEIAKAMHRTACRHQPTWHPFPPVSSPACIVYVCVPVHKRKWQYVLRFHNINISLNNQTGLTDFIHLIVAEVVSWKQFFSDIPIHCRSKQTSTPLWSFFRLACMLIEFTSQTHPEMTAPVQGSYSPS